MRLVHPLLPFIEAISLEPPSCTLATEDGGRFEVQSPLLSLFSPFLATLLAQAGPSSIVSVPFPEPLIRALFGSLSQGRGLSSKEVDLASTEDISEKNSTDQDVAKEEKHFRVKREEVREEKLVEIDKTNENKAGNLSTTIFYSQDDATLYPCEMCGKHFKSKQKVEKHLRSHDEIESKSQECPTCSKILANKAALAGHMRSHEDKPESGVSADRVLCNVCSKTYLNKHVLKAHLLTHDEDQKTSEELSCTLCPKYFRNKYILKYHMNSHNGDGGQMCNLCSKMFAMKSVLRRHMLNIHSENMHPAPCSNCGLKCKLSSLARHEKVCKLSDKEKEERKVKCPECGKKLSTRGKLRTHIRVKHNSEKLPEAV